MRTVSRHLPRPPRKLLLALACLLLVLLFLFDVHGRIIYNSLRVLARFRPRPPLPLDFSSCGDIPQLPAFTPRVAHIPNVTIAIVYLYLSPKTRDHRDYFAELTLSLVSVNRYIRDPHVKKIIVFSDLDSLAPAQVHTLHNLPLTLPLAVVPLPDSNFAMPVSGPASSLHFVRCSYYDLGTGPVFNYRYMQMNAFRLAHLWHQPAIAAFDNLLLIDSDVELTGDFSIPFGKLSNRNVMFGYSKFLADPDECVPPLEVIDHFAKCAGLAKFKGFTNSIFYGALQISNVEFFQSKQFTELVRYLDGLGGIYSHRWSDQNIYFLAVKLFTPGHKAEEFFPLDNLKWSHKGWSQNSPSHLQVG